MHFKFMLLFLGITGMLIRCTPKKSIYSARPAVLEFTWGNNRDRVIEKGKYHSFEKLDTINNELTGDTLIPVRIIENKKLVIHKLVPVSLKMEKKNGSTDFTITKVTFTSDTFTYDIKKYIGKTFLVLYSNASGSQVYELLDGNADLAETHHVNQPVYKVEGYSVGSTVDRNKIKVTYSDLFGDLQTETAILIKNPAVQLTILGGKYIESIKQMEIKEQDTSQIINSVNKKFTVKPEFEKTKNETADLQQVIYGYYWNENEVNITLHKTIDARSGEASTWTLEYSNYIVTNILQNYLQSTPEVM